MERRSNSTPAPAMISHPFHQEHKLRLVTVAVDAEKLDCDGCKEPIGPGCPRYTCKDCNLFLHMSCALAPPVMPEHPLLKDYSFVLLHEPPPVSGCACMRRICDACGVVPRGFVYHCFDRNLDLHPCCADLPVHFTQGGYAFDLCGSGGSRVPRKCSFCVEKAMSQDDHKEKWTYHVHGDGESDHVHVACVKKMMLECLADSHGHIHDGGNNDMHLITASSLKRALKKCARTGSAAAKSFLQFVFSVLVSVFLGDPTGMAVALAGVVFTSF
ncbi:hypothetical protein ABZP36_027879 [Zizania latifolia]